MGQEFETMDKGYFIQDEILSPDECEILVDSISRTHDSQGRAGIRHLMKIPEVKSISSDVRLLRIAKLFLGSSAIPYRATLFEKSGHANWLVAWHQDTALPLENRVDSPDWGPWSEKEGLVYAHAPDWALSRVIALRIHLDASTELNGPLRVVPGTHSLGVLSDDDVSRHARSHSPVECLSPRGGVVAMRPLLIHASSKARVNSPRRVLHIEYVDSLDLSEGVRLAIA